MENEKQKSAESEAENEGRLNVVAVEDVSLLTGEDVSLLTIEAESIEKNPNSLWLDSHNITIL